MYLHKFCIINNLYNIFYVAPCLFLCYNLFIQEHILVRCQVKIKHTMFKKSVRVICLTNRIFLREHPLFWNINKNVNYFKNRFVYFNFSESQISYIYFFVEYIHYVLIFIYVSTLYKCVYLLCR